LFPALTIEPPSDAAAARSLLGGLSGCDYAVFISSNAAEMGLSLLGNEWPAGPRPVAVGEGTAAALRRRGIADVIVAQGSADSDGLLALPQLLSVEGKRILIFRGEGGRERLADELRTRGAEVGYVESYRRGCPTADPTPLLERWERDPLDAVTVMSSETLDNLWAMIGAGGQRLLLRTPVFVPHPNIAERAARIGLTEVAVTPAGDEGILRGLLAWFSLRER
jgi:uroporphyrinogen-III synthase